MRWIYLLCDIEQLYRKQDLISDQSFLETSFKVGVCKPSSDLFVDLFCRSSLTVIPSGASYSYAVQSDVHSPVTSSGTSGAFDTSDMCPSALSSLLPDYTTEAVPSVNSDEDDETNHENALLNGASEVVESLAQKLVQHLHRLQLSDESSSDSGSDYYIQLSQQHQKQNDLDNMNTDVQVQGHSFTFPSWNDLNPDNQCITAVVATDSYDSGIFSKNHQPLSHVLFFEPTVQKINRLIAETFVTSSQQPER